MRIERYSPLLDGIFLWSHCYYCSDSSLLSERGLSICFFRIDGLFSSEVLFSYVLIVRGVCFQKQELKNQQSGFGRNLQNMLISFCFIQPKGTKNCVLFPHIAFILAHISRLFCSECVTFVVFLLIIWRRHLFIAHALQCCALFETVCGRKSQNSTCQLATKIHESAGA